MQDEQYEQQMQWEADQNAEDEAITAQAEAEIEQMKQEAHLNQQPTQDIIS